MYKRETEKNENDLHYFSCKKGRKESTRSSFCLLFAAFVYISEESVPLSLYKPNNVISLFIFTLI
jgi:hypothetical protein